MLTDMKVFSRYIVQATIETVAQQIEQFNAASNGAIVLSAEGFDGDFIKRSFFQGLASTRRRVDRYDTNAGIPSTALAQLQDNGVKVAGGFGPIVWEPSQLSWMQMNEVDAIDAVSKSLSEAILQDQLNTAILAGVAAISNNADTIEDVSGSANITQIGLNASHAKFGDASQNLVAQVMSGMGYHALIGEALGNKQSLFSSGNVTVIDILGKSVIVTDAPALTVTGTPTIGNTLALAVGGLVVTNTTDIITNIETSNGKNRIETTFQGDYTFGLNVKGYAWDTENGGKSPDDTDLGTGTNWDKVMTSSKDTAGTVLKYDTTAV